MTTPWKRQLQASRSRVRQFNRAAESVLLKCIERALLDGQDYTAARSVAHDARRNYLLPVIDSRVEELLLDAVKRISPALLPSLEGNGR